MLLENGGDALRGAPPKALLARIRQLRHQQKRSPSNIGRLQICRIGLPGIPLQSERKNLCARFSEKSLVDRHLRQKSTHMSASRRRLVRKAAPKIASAAACKAVFAGTAAHKFFQPPRTPAAARAGSYVQKPRPIPGFKFPGAGTGPIAKNPQAISSYTKRHRF